MHKLLFTDLKKKFIQIFKIAIDSINLYKFDELKQHLCV